LNVSLGTNLFSSSAIAEHTCYSNVNLV
jgi:hypothetical protein